MKLAGPGEAMQFFYFCVRSAASDSEIDCCRSPQLDGSNAIIIIIMIMITIVIMIMITILIMIMMMILLRYYYYYYY